MATAWLDADWPAPRAVRALTTLRHGLGVSAAPFDHFNLGNHRAADGDDPAAVERNRALLVEHAGLPSAPHWLRQVHGVQVRRFDVPLPRAPRGDFLRGAGEGWGGGARQSMPDEGDSNRRLRDGLIGACPHPPSGHLAPRPALARSAQAFLVARASGSQALLVTPQAGEGDEPDPEADAAVTSTPGNVLAILTADCLPVLLCADDGSEVAAAHAGWRGLADGMLEATVAAMRTPADRVLAWLGPAAGPAHYEVGIEVYDAFVSRDWAAGRAFTSTRPRHWRVDLYALARQRLAQAGIAGARIYGGDLCTIAEPARFYSHRRDRRSGRMATLVWLDPGR